jgi:HEPN domain-containing protein
MHPRTLEWVEKAEADFQSLQREMRARKLPNLDGACFHAQQCIEKYLTARLQEADRHFPKIHDLGKLLDLIKPEEPLWEAFRPDMKVLNGYAVEVRYPGRMADRAMAREAPRICRKLREVMRNSLGAE